MEIRLQTRTGFTLIEISIVLVIIGLLVGGVLTGQTLIHAAELRKFASLYTQYQVAYNTFVGKYNCIPGDCSNATAFFGATDANGNAIINGDGDGRIDGWEAWRVWPHLSYAGMVAGSYKSAYGSTDADFIVPGVQFPATPFSAGGKGIMGIWYVAATTDPNFYQGHSGNMLVMAEDTDQMWQGPYPCYSQGCLFAPDVQSLDDKLDDGKPFSGHATVNWGWWACVKDGTTPAEVQTNAYELGMGTLINYSICGLQLELD